jgi:hypothetical protein
MHLILQIVFVSEESGNAAGFDSVAVISGSNYSELILASYQPTSLPVISDVNWFAVVTAADSAFVEISHSVQTANASAAWMNAFQCKMSG